MNKQKPPAWRSTFTPRVVPSRKVGHKPKAIRKAEAEAARIEAGLQADARTRARLLIARAVAGAPKTQPKENEHE